MSVWKPYRLLKWNADAWHEVSAHATPRALKSAAHAIRCAFPSVSLAQCFEDGGNLRGVHLLKSDPAYGVLGPVRVAPVHLK